MKQLAVIAFGCAALAIWGCGSDPEHDARDAEAHVRANWEEIAEEHGIVDEAGVTLGPKP